MHACARTERPQEGMTLCVLWIAVVCVCVCVGVQELLRGTGHVCSQFLSRAGIQQDSACMRAALYSLNCSS